jgi:hypothetical protein
MPIHAFVGGSSILNTPLGGSARRFINDTGAPSIKGTLVDASHTTDFGVVTVAADSPDCMGVIYEDGIPNGEEVWVVTHGPAEVLLENATAATRGYWARVSVTAPGRADITNPLPPGGTIVEIDNHFREVGHGMESVIAGTDKLARVFLHFN